MAYSLVGLLAIVVLLIINFDVILDIKSNKKFRGEKFYLFFLISVILFHVADACWGFINEAKLVKALFVDTTLYFIAMASSILLWGVFIYHYLGFKKQQNKLILYISLAIFTFQIAVIITNFFSPVLFSISDECVYAAGPVRYVNLAIQVLMYLILSLYTLMAARKVGGSSKRKHITVAFFGLFMILAIILQVFFPLMPFYSLGYLLGICVLHTFVFRDMLAAKVDELDETKHQVMVDALTGVYSKHAYIDVEDDIEKKISSGAMCDFAMVVFDLNDLKFINDTYGHEEGDNYLVDSTKLIGKYFKNIPVYRVGGDEFVAILIGRDYEKREEYLKAFNAQIDLNVRNKQRTIVSAGIATFEQDRDTTILKVFTRSDRQMYVRKQELKEEQNQ